MFSYRQASARPQCSCSCHNQHQQVGYDSGLSSILHNDLHRLDVTERIQFRVAATVYKCLHSMAPAYLTELCSPIAASTSRHGMLRSATTSNLVISLQTVSLRHPCLQCRWSSLLECFTGLYEVTRPII